MLYPSEVFTLNSYPFSGYPVQTNWFENGTDDFVIRTVESSHACPKRNLVLPGKHKRRSSTLDLSMYRTEEPRSILKRSVSADAACMTEWKTNLCKEAFKSHQSIPLVKSEPEITSPRSQKNVTFADDNNLLLVEVRKFVPSSENVNLWVTDQARFNVEQCAQVEIANYKLQHKLHPALVLSFTEPSAMPDFLERFKHRCVMLEKCATRDRTVTGVILVKNIEYHKKVVVRYTTDSWTNSDDTGATYLTNSNDGETDRFTFSLTLPKEREELEFAICYKTSTNEFWDNNYNRNYIVQDVLQNASQ